MIKTKRNDSKLLFIGSCRSWSGSTLTWPRAFSSIIRCSMLATSLRVNTAASGIY
ncbi:MAG: hypothetical protein QXI42_11705 [Thermoproteota archaeon]